MSPRSHLSNTGNEMSVCVRRDWTRVHNHDLDSYSEALSALNCMCTCVSSDVDFGANSETDNDVCRGHTNEAYNDVNHDVSKNLKCDVVDGANNTTNCQSVDTTATEPAVEVSPISEQMDLTAVLNDSKADRYLLFRTGSRVCMPTDVAVKRLDHADISYRMNEYRHFRYSVCGGRVAFSHVCACVRACYKLLLSNLLARYVCYL